MYLINLKGRQTSQSISDFFLNPPDLSQPDPPSLSRVSLLLSKGNLVHFFDLLAAVVEHKHLAGRGGFVYVDLEGGKAAGAVLGGRGDKEKDYGQKNGWQYPERHI